MVNGRLHKRANVSVLRACLRHQCSNVCRFSRWSRLFLLYTFSASFGADLTRSTRTATHSSTEVAVIPAFYAIIWNPNFHASNAFSVRYVANFAITRIAINCAVSTQSLASKQAFRWRQIPDRRFTGVWRMMRYIGDVCSQTVASGITRRPHSI